MKGRTPTALLREKFQSSSYSSVGPNANAVKSASRREQLVCYMKAEGHGDPNFKATKLGTGERERFIAAVTVLGQQFKTYPKTFPSKVEAEEALAALVLDKLSVKQNPSIASLDERPPPPIKLPEEVLHAGRQQDRTKILTIKREPSPPIRHPSYSTLPPPPVGNTVKREQSPPIRHPSYGTPPPVLGRTEILKVKEEPKPSYRTPPPVFRTVEQTMAVRTRPSPPSPPSSVCSTTFSKRGVRAEELFQASLAADNDRWLQFQIEPTVPAKEQAKQLEAWLAKNLPSKVARSQGIGWIAVKLKDKGKKVAEAKVAWEALTGPRNMKVVNQLAKQYSVLGGKWMCHLASGKIDRVWSKVASTLLAGGLGTPVYMVKVSPLEDVTPQQAGAGGEHVMIVYNTDYRDTDQVMRVENLLRCAGVTTPLNYKPDIFSALGIYRNNEWGFRPTIYTSHCLVSESRSRVETVGTGEWFYNSTKGLQRPEMSESPRLERVLGMKKEKGNSHGLGSLAKEPQTSKGLEKADKHKEVGQPREVTKEEVPEQTLKQMAEEVIKPMSMMMIKGGQGSSSSALGCKKTVSPVKKAQEKKGDVQRSPKEDGKLSVKSSEVKVGDKGTPGKEKKSLPAWMEKIERQLGLISLDELANF